MRNVDAAVIRYIGTVGRMASVKYWDATGNIVSGKGWVRVIDGNRVALTTKRSKTAARTVTINVFDIVSI